MSTFDRESFTDYDVEDGGDTLILRNSEDIWKVPVRVYARANKVMVGSETLIKNRRGD